eukprot:TRINITY_DN21966_c0_g1_i3.p2 TRINITY_DN21966_c0_g1~~TRINITY_DN21966_c0_g1_i3.p2  ORF type:complete len:239 (-),score=-17.23 TRINITY_DN21966_c0_g1_i3:115-801(-)
MSDLVNVSYQNSTVQVSCLHFKFLVKINSIVIFCKFWRLNFKLIQNQHAGNTFAACFECICCFSFSLYQNFKNLLLRLILIILFRSQFVYMINVQIYRNMNYLESAFYFFKNILCFLLLQRLGVVYVQYSFISTMQCSLYLKQNYILMVFFKVLDVIVGQVKNYLVQFAKQAFQNIAWIQIRKVVLFCLQVCNSLKVKHERMKFGNPGQRAVWVSFCRNDEKEILFAG